MSRDTAPARRSPEDVAEQLRLQARAIQTGNAGTKAAIGRWLLSLAWHLDGKDEPEAHQQERHS